MALALLTEKIQLAILFGSVAKRSDHARSDIDLLLVSNNATLEEIYAALAPVEERLGRKISPTLYKTLEFKTRCQTEGSFLQKVLAGEHVVLMGDKDGIE